MIGKFAKDTFITFIARILGAILGVITSIVIARVLGPKGKGIYSLSILLPSLLITFGNFGITSATVFYLGKRKYSPSEIFGNNILIMMFVSLLTILVGLVVVFFFRDSLFAGVEITYLFLALSMIPFAFFFNFVCHILLGLQKIKLYNLVEIIQISSFFILIMILLLLFQRGISATIINHVLSFALAGAVLFFLARKETYGISMKFSREYFRDAISFGLKIHLGSVFSFLHYRVDLLLVNLFLNPMAVGFYSIAAGLAEGILLFSQAVATTHFPKAASEKSERSLSEFTPLVCRNVLPITLFIAILLWLFSRPIIVLLFSERFKDSITPFRILLIGLLAITGWRILANDLTARGKPILNTYLIGASVIVNVILNILLIPRLEILGAAWASTLSYTFMFIATVFIYRRVSYNKLRDIVFPQKGDVDLYKRILLDLKARLL